MIKNVFVFLAILFQALLLSNEGAANTNLSNSEIKSLVQPIALYPDILLKNILPASTFPDQIVDASLLLKSKEDAAKIENQTWDRSVKVIANYPGVLKMMSQKIDWTTSLGEAFMRQDRDVLEAIQTIRLEAQKGGALKSDDKQTVTSEQRNGDTIIQIQPADPEVIYVPSETVVTTGGSYYSSPSVLAPLATFGVGLAIGAALDNDDHYYYSGWGGSSFWYDQSPVNHWMDNRRAAWEDHNDRAWDRQDFRQDQRSDRQDFRQEMYREGNVPSKDQMNDFRQQQRTERKDAFQQRNPQAASQAQARVQARSATTTGTTPRGWSTARSGSSSTVSRGWGSASNSASSRTAFQGYGSRGSTTAMSSRGSVSRSSAGFGGGARGGFRGGGGGRGRR